MSVLIIGGGLAGSAAAITLARAGCDVTLIEREPKPHHKVCGEFLSREALLYLASLNISVEALGAVPIRHVRLGDHARTELPFVAMSLTRRTLDAHLLHTAELSGASVLRGCRVETIEREAHSWRAATASKTLRADALFLATGKHDLRAHPRPAGRQSDLVAFKMYFRLTPDQTAALDATVELHLYRGGYAGLQPVEDGAANLTCLIQRAELRRLGGWDGLLQAMQADCPLLQQRLRAARPLLQKPLAIAAIPYGYVRAAGGIAGRDAGLWALGDQAAVIPSFTGDGMSIALHSGCLAARMYLQGAAPDQFHRRLHSQLSRQVGLATAIARCLIWQPSRRAMVAAVNLWPGLLTVVANQTRISPQALG